MLIGEVARSTGLSVSAIRYYETSGVVPPPGRGPAGYRNYDPNDVDLLRFVGRLRALNVPLDDIGRVVGLRTSGLEPCGALREALAREAEAIARWIEELERVRDELERLRTEAESIQDEWPDHCVCSLVDPPGRERSPSRPVRVTLQYFDGCPNWKDTDRLLAQLGVAVDYQRIESPEEAVEHGFRGSPTVLVDGVDPFFDPDAQVGLACRVYASPEGLSGKPPVVELERALAPGNGN